MQSEDEFLVLACDGIYDVLENDELREIVRHRLSVSVFTFVLFPVISKLSCSSGAR
jgi:serine/threonine protein phosphatase PrpC